MKFTLTLDVEQSAQEIVTALRKVAESVATKVTDISQPSYSYVDGARWQLMTEKGWQQSRVEDADRVKRAEYYDDVRDTASSIKDELHDRIKDGERGESLREWLMQHIHETVDGSSRVICTAEAQECLLFSDNDGAYFEEFGADGAVEDGAINWSRLAFAAFERDVTEELDSMGVDVNNPDANVDDEEEDEEEDDEEEEETE